MKKKLLITSISFLIAQQAQALLVVELNDAREWQGAAGFVAQHHDRSQSSNQRQQTIENLLLDDEIFDTSDYTLSTFRYAAAIRLEPEALTHHENSRILTAKRNYRAQISVPEPSSVGLMLLGALGMLIIRRRIRDV